MAILYERVHPKFGTIRIAESQGKLVLEIDDEPQWSGPMPAHDEHARRQSTEVYFLVRLFLDRLYEIGYDAKHLLSQKLTDEAEHEPLVTRSKALAMIRDAVNLIARG